jgi:UDP-N-acetylglucosamine:LPS N-acetylglucosamine transferase
MYAQIKELLADESRRAAMSAALKDMVQIDSAEQICDIVEQLIAK